MKTNISTYLKIILTILAAVLWVYLVQAHSAPKPSVDPQKTFDVYNDEYFDGMLPRNTVVRYGVCRDGNGALLDSISCTTHPEDIFHITLIERYNLAPSDVAENVLHEGCHIATWSEFEEHGPRFKDCIHRLMEKGAYDGLL